MCDVGICFANETLRNFYLIFFSFLHEMCHFPLKCSVVDLIMQWRWASHSSIYFYWISRSRQIQFCSACNNDWKGRNVVDDVLIKQQMKFAFQRLLLLLYRISDVIWMPNKQAKDAVTRLNWIPAYADASGRKIPQIKSFRIFERILKNLYKYRLAYHTVYCSFAKTLLCHAFQNVQPNAIKGVHNSEQHQYLITTQLGA